MGAETKVSNSTQCGLFIGDYKKYALSGVTFSFKETVELRRWGSQTQKCGLNTLKLINWPP